jgi:hypothetical protein
MEMKDKVEDFLKKSIKVDNIKELATQIDLKPNEYLFRELVNIINFEEEEFEELINFLVRKYDVHGELNEILGYLEDRIDFDNGQDGMTIQYKKRISESVW